MASNRTLLVLPGDGIGPEVMNEVRKIIAKLMDDASRGSNAIIEIDLEKQEIKGPDGGTVHFDIDPFRKHCLLNGLDDIGLTLEKAASIDSFEARDRMTRPWLWA